MMNRLICDIELGGSTEQFLSYGKRTMTEDAFIDSIKKALMYRARTKPTVIGRRLGCLLGLTYDRFEGDSYILDCIIKAFHLVESELQK